MGIHGPVPARVTGADKAALLDLVDDALDVGWPLARVCAVLEVDRRRVWRWQTRRTTGCLEDRPSGGNPTHGLLEWERAEVLALFDDWGGIDRSHRKLAYRGSYEGRVWVSPSTVDRVLADAGLVLAGNPRPPRGTKTPWPEWTQWRPNQLWCWDGTRFEAAAPHKYAYGIIDLVSRRWIASHLTDTPDSVAARVLFSKALETEGLLTPELAERLTDPDVGLPDDDETVPLLLAISDNGTEMGAKDTRRFMATASIVQHFGRPATPTDQASIESLWGHIKGEHPHLLAITCLVSRFWQGLFGFPVGGFGVGVAVVDLGGSVPGDCFVGSDVVVVVAPVLDRLMHNAIVFNIKGPSWRLREHNGLQIAATTTSQGGLN